jgi:hypothetical protein
MRQDPVVDRKAFNEVQNFKYLRTLADTNKEIKAKDCRR